MAELLHKPITTVYCCYCGLENKLYQSCVAVEFFSARTGILESVHEIPKPANLSDTLVIARGAVRSSGDLEIWVAA
jgi:hypothetical protein